MVELVAVKSLLTKKIQLGLDADHSHVEINQGLLSTFVRLYALIIAAITKAKEEKKPFILLVGENHYSLQSFFFKNLIIDMMYQLGVTVVGYETTEKELWRRNVLYNTGCIFLDEFFIDRLNLSKLREDLSKLNPESKEYKKISEEQRKYIREGQDGELQQFMRTINHIKKKQMKLIPLDDPDSQEHTYAISMAGMIKRELYMSKMLSVEIDDPNNNTEDAIAIVGSAHLLGLFNILKNKYFVLAIDTLNSKEEYDLQNRLLYSHIFIKKKNTNSDYSICITDEFRHETLAKSNYYKNVDSDYRVYTPSKDFWTAIQRESLKRRAVLGIPRTVLLIFNRATSIFKKKSHQSSKISFIKNLDTK